MATLKYEAEDGALFGSLEEAERHEKRQKQIHDKIYKLSGALFHNTDLSSSAADLIAEFLLTDKETLEVLRQVFVAEPASDQEKV